MNLEIEIVEHLNKASEFLKAANLCFNAKLWNASVSRSYYSIYHTAIAVVLHFFPLISFDQTFLS